MSLIQDGNGLVFEIVRTIRRVHVIALSVVVLFYYISNGWLGMNEKSTRELVEILGKTHLSEFDKYCETNKDSMNTGDSAFSAYIKGILSEKGITQQAVFVNADIPERYGYKFLVKKGLNSVM